MANISGSNHIHLICPVDCQQLYSSVAEEGEDSSVPLSGCFPLHMCNCSTKQHLPVCPLLPTPSQLAASLSDWASTGNFILIHGWLCYQLPLPILYCGTTTSRGLVARSWRLPVVTAPGLVHWLSSATLWHGCYLPPFKSEEIIKSFRF